MDGPNNDGGERALSRLPMQFRGKPRIEAFTTAYVQQAQDADAGAFTLWTGRQLATAQGAMLDVYGRLVGEDRLGRADPDYRIGIMARQAINRSSGTGPDLLRILRLLTPPPLTVSLRESFPAGVLLQVAGGVLPLPQAVNAALRSAKAAGVSMHLHVQDGPDAERFVFSGGVGLGFAGHPSDFVGEREDIQTTGWTGGSAGPVSVIVSQDGAPAPAAYRYGNAPVADLGTVQLIVAGGVDQFIWSSSNGAGSDTPSDFFPDGGDVAPLINERPGFPADVGIGIEWVPGEPYIGDDIFAFDVTPSIWMPSAAPTLAQAATLRFTGRVQVVAMDQTSFSYRLGSRPWNEGVPMMKGTPRPLFIGGVASGLTLTWPNADTFNGATYAWQVAQANNAPGGRWTSVLG